MDEEKTPAEVNEKETETKEELKEETTEPSVSNEEPQKNGSGSGLVILIIIIVVLIIAALAYMGYKNLGTSSTSETASATAVSENTVAATSTLSIDPNSTPARDPELSVLARKYFDWIIAEQRSGEDLVASETYKNLDYLTQKFKDSVKPSSDSWQMSALTMGTEPINRYTIDGNYAQQDGQTGQINCTVYSTSNAWNVVFFTVKENGVWKIDNVGTAS